MEHVAIMRKSWGLTEKILDGRKRIESRWYSVKYKPWNDIKSGEVVYFKDSGEPIKIKAEVERVVQFNNLTPKKVEEILNKFGKDDGIEKELISEFFDRFKNKKYCILIFLKNPIKVEPFNIDKTGFGAMSAWITVSDVFKIRKFRN
ncbi:MAG: ASCH domain-containing protein [Patescibacteria group bacterium]